MDALYATMLVFTLLLSAIGGWWLRGSLDERHLSRDSVDSVRLLMGMLLTFAALVLGLLTSNAKQRFDGLSDSLSIYGAELIELDHRLRVYGHDADDVRRLLRSYTAAAIADSWPNEVRPSGDYPRFKPDVAAGDIEGKQLGDMLSEVDLRIEHLQPEDGFHVLVASRLRDRVALVIQHRWGLIFSSHSKLSWPFLLILTSWLSIIFAIFGMTSPPGRVVYAVVALSAISVASPLYLIIDYSQALSGNIQLSSEPMRVALFHIDGS